MKHIKTFESFLNEGHLPFKIEKTLQLGGVSFEFDEERTDEDDDSRFDFVLSKADLFTTRISEKTFFRDC